MSFSVLLVCTGNTHRSVAAEYLLRTALGPASPVTVESAGIRAYSGQPTAPEMQQALLTLGVDAGDHRSAQLDLRAIARSDLILTMTVAHRDRVVRLSPAAMRRTFALREFLRLAAGVTVPTLDPDCLGDDLSGLEDLPSRVAARRGRVPVALESEDVADPVGQSQRDVQNCAIEIDTLVRALVGLLSLSEPQRRIDVGDARSRERLGDGMSNTSGGPR